MYRIMKKEQLAPNIYSMDILAPRVAKSAQPGQFIVIITSECDERVPLTICDYDVDAGTVNIVFQTMGAGTKALAELEEGDSVYTFVGPLGRPSDFVEMDLEELKKQKWVFIAGGVGTAPVYPQIKWLHERGIGAEVILGAKTKDIIILEDKLRAVSSELHVATDDGSYGFSGMVTDCLVDLVENKGKKYDQCVAIGPMIMMKFVCLTTKKLDIPTIVSLNPLMVDATGMCGACRVSVGGETKFACVDGPEFDGHLVDFDEALRRQGQLKLEESEKLEIYERCGFWGGGK